MRTLRGFLPSIQALEDRRLLATIINDGGPGFSATPVGAWTLYTSSAYYQGDDHEALAGDGSAHADFTFAGLPAGQRYDVQVTWPVYSNRAPDAPYAVTDGSATLGTAVVDQLVAPSMPADSTGVAWQSLGSYSSSTGTLDVRLSSVADGNVEADAVRIVPVAATPSAPAVGDAGFEQVSVGSGSGAYAGDPSGSAWTFASPPAGPSAGYSGLSANNTDFTGGNPPAPQGSQVALLQDQGLITQSVPGWAAGSYTISFDAAQRGNYQASRQDFKVEVDGSVVGTFTPSGTSYQVYTTSPFSVAAGAHTVAFVGLDSAGGDNTAFLDAVRINAVASPPTTQIINDGGPGFSATPAGAWTLYTSSAYYQGDDHEALAGDGSAHADFTFAGLPAGQRYDVQVTWPVYSNRAPDAPYAVTDGSATLGTAVVDQLVAPSMPADSTGVAWQSLGSYSSSTGTLDVRLSSVADGNVEADAVRIVPVSTAPQTVTVAATTPEATEGDPTPGIFKISRTGDLTYALPVTYAVGGTAVAGTDYQGLSGQVVIPAGSASVDVPVIPIGTPSSQGDVAASLFIQDSSNGYVAGGGVDRNGSPQSSSATVIIHDGLPGVSIVTTAAETSEGGSIPASFTLTRTGDVSADLTVAISVGGTAVSGVTYQPFGVTSAANTSVLNITIPAGSTQVTVPVTPSYDTRQTTDRELDLSIASATAYSVAGRNSVTLTFHNAPIYSNVSIGTRLDTGVILMSIPDTEKVVDGAIVQFENPVTSLVSSANDGTISYSGNLVWYTPNKGFIGLDQISLTVTAEYPFYLANLGNGNGLTLVNYVSFSGPLGVAPPVTSTTVDGDLVASADQSTLYFTSDSTASLPRSGQTYVNAEVDDGSVVSWEVIDSSGHIQSGQAPTQGGMASWSVKSDQIAGEAYSIIARVSTITVEGGAAAPISFFASELGKSTEAIVPGTAASITFSKSVDHLVSDGQSQTTITLKARDAEGNLVADGTPVDWSLIGGGRLVAPDAVTLNGKATVTLQAGIMAEDQTVSATIDGYGSSTVVYTNAVNISLAVTIGSDQATLVTATVTDSSGAPVPDGTPITWYAQKGVIAGGATVSQGKATASIYLPNGFPASGWGVVKAFVGSNVGSANINYINGSTQAQVSVAHRLIAGDATGDGSYAVEQVDGTFISYNYSAGTDGAIRNGQPGATVIIALPTAGDGGNLLTVSGDSGVPGSSASVTLDAQGNGSFHLQSTGGLPSDRMIEVPVTASYTVYSFIYGTYADTPFTTFNVALQPAEHVARTLDYIGKLGWTVLAGPGDSADEIAADMAFSFIPGIGVYSDIRDAASELSKLWPGGESPDYLSLGFALAGIISEVTPADTALDFAKGLYKAAKVGIINPGGALVKASLQKFKDLGSQLASGGTEILQKIDELCNTLDHFLPPPFGHAPSLTVAGFPNYTTFVDQVLVRNPDDVRILQLLSQKFDDFDSTIAGIASKFGADAAKRVDDILGSLDEAATAAIVQANKFDIVSKGVANGGWTKVDIQDYIARLNDPRIPSSFIATFDQFADVPNSATLIKRLFDPNGGLAAELMVAEKLGKDNLAKFSGNLAPDTSAYDILTKGNQAIEVKSSINSANSSELNGKLDRLVAYCANIPGAKAVIAFQDVATFSPQVQRAFDRVGFTEANFLRY